MESKWANLTDRLLMDKHIKIPIEKRFYLSFLENDETNINKQKIIEELNKCGFLKDDPRLIKLRNNLKEANDILTYEDFKQCIENNILIVSNILRKELIIPNFEEFENQINDIYNQTKNITEGENASYIPQLKIISVGS